MNEIRADVLATRLLRGGKPISEVVEATGLEPREVYQLAQKLKVTAVPQPPAGEQAKGAAKSTLPELSQAVQWHSGQSGYPAKARTALRRAAEALGKAVAEVEADAGKAAKRAELQRLEAQVKKLRAELRGGASAVTSEAPARDWKAVRAWARANGYEVGDVGVPKKDIVEAYDQAVAS